MSGKITTITLPLFSGLLPISNAATVAAPLDIPAKIPSSFARLFAAENASSFFTLIISSISSLSKTSGTKPAPMPWILCGPGPPPERTGESNGSTATTLKPGFLFLITCATPVSVPPVPTPLTTISTLPSVSFQISSAVVSLCIFGFAGFLNCCGINEPLVFFASSSAFSMAPFMPFSPGVKTISAPNNFKTCRRSMLIVSGIVIISL